MIDCMNACEKGLNTYFFDLLPNDIRFEQLRLIRFIFENILLCANGINVFENGRKTSLMAYVVNFSIRILNEGAVLFVYCVVC